MSEVDSCEFYGEVVLRVFQCKRIASVYGQAAYAHFFLGFESPYGFVEDFEVCDCDCAILFPVLPGDGRKERHYGNAVG